MDACIPLCTKRYGMLAEVKEGSYAMHVRVRYVYAFPAKLLSHHKYSLQVFLYPNVRMPKLYMPNRTSTIFLCLSEPSKRAMPSGFWQSFLSDRTRIYLAYTSADRLEATKRLRCNLLHINSKRKLVHLLHAVSCKAAQRSQNSATSGFYVA